VGVGVLLGQLLGDPLLELPKHLLEERFVPAPPGCLLDHGLFLCELLFELLGQVDVLLLVREELLGPLAANRDLLQEHAFRLEDQPPVGNLAVPRKLLLQTIQKTNGVLEELLLDEEVDLLQIAQGRAREAGAELHQVIRHPNLPQWLRRGRRLGARIHDQRLGEALA